MDGENSRAGRERTLRTIATTLVVGGLIAQIEPFIALAVEGRLDAAVFSARYQYAGFRAVMPTVLLLASLPMIWWRNLAAQIFARSVWGLVCMFAVVSAATHTSPIGQATLFTLCCGGALAVLGRLGLRREDSPAMQLDAFRTSILAVMFMAMSLGILLVYAAPVTPLLGVLGLAFLLGSSALYRLRGWGIVLTMLASLAAVPTGAWAAQDGAIWGGTIVMVVALVQLVVLGRVLGSVFPSRRRD